MAKRRHADLLLIMTLMLFKKHASSFLSSSSSRRTSLIRHRSKLLSTTTSQISVELWIETPDDMEELGALLGATSIRRGSTILLDGDLGAGKTCFSRGFVQQLAFADKVTSPTYLLCNSYPSDSGIFIHHMDLYRIDEKRRDVQLAAVDLHECLARGICLIEWPQRLGSENIPPKRLELDLTISDATQKDDDDITPRVVTMTPVGEEWEQQLHTLQQEGLLEDWLIIE